MLFRQAGICHTDYAADRALFPIPARPRAWSARCCCSRLVAPLVVSSLALSSYLHALAGLDRGRAGAEPDPRLGRAVPLRLRGHHGHRRLCRGARRARTACRGRSPIVLGGLTATVVGIVFAFAALRVKGLYLALSTLALQFVMDWVISHVPAISGGVVGHAAGAADAAAGPGRARRRPGCTTSRSAGACWSRCSCSTCAAPRSAARWWRCARRTSPPPSSACRASTTSWWPSRPRRSSAASAARC